MRLGGSVDASSRVGGPATNMRLGGSADASDHATGTGDVTCRRGHSDAEHVQVKAANPNHEVDEEELELG